MKNQIQAKFDKLASGYSAKYMRPTNILGFEKLRRMELLVEYVDLIKPVHLLDAGCGPGVVLSVLISRLPSATLVGTDISYSMLRQVRNNKQNGLPLVQCRVEQLAFADNSFDLIYALGVLDYLADPSEFFKSVRRIIKPSGYFIFTYPNGDSVNRTLRTLYRTYRAGSRAAISSVPIKRATIDQLFVEYGFELLGRHYLTYGNGLFSLPWSMSMSRKMEDWCNKESISRRLAWTCFCVARGIAT